jgi:AcrR family transcriptional regulator
MSDNGRSPLPTGLAKQRRNDKQRRKPDLGIRRTRSLLSNALVAFMQEKSIDKITVQEVPDRATVGRSTFYLHYCDKDDLFLCVLEEGLEMWSATLSGSRRNPTASHPWQNVLCMSVMRRSSTALWSIPDVSTRFSNLRRATSLAVSPDI